MAALSAKDLDWSRENLSAGMNQESGNTKKKKDIKPAAAHPGGVRTTIALHAGRSDKYLSFAS